MRVHKSSLFLMEVIIIAIVVFSFGLFIWWLFEKESNVSDVQIRGQMLRIQVSSETYYARLQFYDGICSDIGVPTNFNCDETTESFAVETKLPNGRYLCIDNTGFLGEIGQSKRDAVSCSGAR
ncbi:hypothetical protein H6789_03160 [Candidatus Nomurabacteria bacterium]|nr:hypothetical protein [Candidatus Nomurabacteria bacterium]